MSVSAMTRLLQIRLAEDERAGRVLDRTMAEPLSTEAARKSTEQAAAAAERAKLTALDKLSAFVPTEVITAWAAAVGLIVPTTHLHRWLIFIAAVILLVVMIVLNTLILRKQAPPDSKLPANSTTAMLLLILLSTAAFTVWAFAVPGSPAVMWGDDATRIFAVVSIFVTPVLYRAARLWGLAPLE